MAFQQDIDASQKHKLSIPETSNGCFDCNICLDSCHEPVVTLCGHLYCWPCIYKWLNLQNSSIESDEPPKCPVCKALISASSLIPLYGRGRSSSESESKKPQLDLIIPQRPAALGVNNPNPFQPQNGPFHQQQYISNYTTITPPSFGGTPTTPSFYSPTINMVGEMVFSGIFGSSDTTLFPHPYSNSYPVLGNGSPRLRRQVMHLDKSLNRVSIFLFFCAALCLLLF